MTNLCHAGSGPPREMSPSAVWKQFCLGTLLLTLYFVLAASPCIAQGHETLCNNGSGSFQAEFHTGVSVQVRAARTGGLATRTCEANLDWKKNRLTVATDAAQLDVDTFGVDMGLGVLVTSFQLKKSGDDCCMEYRVYSLEQPPRLLRTITGGTFFAAADTDLDGRIEIWTNDAAAVEDFEHLGPAQLDSAPTIVLRFTHGELLDVSSEFQPYFDREIAALRQELDSEGLRDFRNSNGKLLPNAPFSAERLHQLRGMKAKILEIVWDYLYSGREQQGWSALAEMWPATDAVRIRAAILDLHARGISKQVNGVSNERPGRRQTRVSVFDAIGKSASGKLEVTPPVPIMLRRPPLEEAQNSDLVPSVLLLQLVVDSAGKVRSAEPAEKAQSADAVLTDAANGWKFIPAFKAGRPVASRIRLAVSLRQ